MPAQFERPSWDEYFMLQAELAKLRSNCMTRKVGAVIVRDHRQIATGYNGTPPGIKNFAFSWYPLKYSIIAHIVKNASGASGVMITPFVWNSTFETTNNDNIIPALSEN